MELQTRLPLRIKGLQAFGTERGTNIRIIYNHYLPIQYENSINSVSWLTIANVLEQSSHGFAKTYITL